MYVSQGGGGGGGGGGWNICKGGGGWANTPPQSHLPTSKINAALQVAHRLNTIQARGCDHSNYKCID